MEDESIKVVEHNVRNNGLLSIREHFDTINTQIDSFVKEKKNVLIHCVYGQTRSCSCAIGYFIWKDRVRFDEALRLVQSRREECEIPNGMEQFLREYERQLLEGVTNESIDASCCNAVVKILSECDSSEKIKECLNAFKKACPHCRFGSHITKDVVFGLNRYTIPAYIREDIDLDEWKDELEPFLSPIELQDISVDEIFM